MDFVVRRPRAVSHVSTVDLIPYHHFAAKLSNSLGRPREAKDNHLVKLLSDTLVIHAVGVGLSDRRSNNSLNNGI